MVRELLKSVLDPEYAVVAVASGTEALGVLRTRRVNAVVLDMLMPEMDGLVTLVGVVMLTAVDTARNMRDALTLGAVDYLTKPFRCDELRAAVRSAIGDPAASLLHVARDVGARASLAVLLTQRHGLEVQSTSPDRLDASPSTPAVILVEPERGEHAAMLETVARRFAHVPIVVAADDPGSIDVGRVPAFQ